MGKVMKSKALTKSVVKQASSVVKQQKRKGFVAQKGERGQGLKFSLETFQTVASFEPGTRIQYIPNPKTPGSKSYVRYERYVKSKTVGEALKNGSSVADLCWELPRGYYKILGGKRSDAEEIKVIGQKAFDRAKSLLASKQGPQGLQTKNLNDPRAKKLLEKEEAWRNNKLKKCEKLAKEWGLPVETVEEVEAFGESTDLRMERRVADILCEKKLKTGKKITDQDLQEVLELWGFSENHGRLNVMQEGIKYVYSDTIGAIRRRTGTYGMTPPTTRYPNFPRLMNKWLKDNMIPLPQGAKMVWTAINVNANYAAVRHRDQNNEGLSIIRAFGAFKGGKLRYWPHDKKAKGRAKVEALQEKDCIKFDLKKTTALFDGNRAHEVEEFEGERYSIVFFSSSGWHKMKGDDVKKMTKMGFEFPTKTTMEKFKKATAAA